MPIPRPIAALAGWLFCAAGCSSNVLDDRAEGSFDVPEGTHTLRMTLEKGEISALPSADGRITYEALVRRGATAAGDLPLLEAVVAELRVEPGPAGELHLVGPAVPAALAARDRGAAIVMRIGIRVPAELNLVLRTGRGPLGATEWIGDLDLRTDSGNIRLDHVRGAARTFTGAGFHLVHGHTGPAAFESEHGDIVAYFDAVDPTAGISIAAKSGNVQCKLPRGAEFALTAEAAFGEVVVGYPVQPEPFGERGMRAVVQIGGGGAPVRLFAKRGNVSVREAEAQ